MKRKKEKHEKKIDKALHLAEERMELLDTIKEMVETEVDKQMKKVCRRVKSEKNSKIIKVAKTVKDEQ
ncbi:hypothetical protein [Tannerella forsythia]|uniref:hypothetical protein n=2 Tax=Tannerella TaxID=195950 RepID=UPI00062B2BDD|nr:hypothetical protein [Tannerella forsythia]KKY62072.1 hypothetical protein Tanf_04505 [Tannerella forsythia]TPE15496.1 hypothetical protein FJN16_12830 [Tannerella forsythia]